MNKYSYIWGLWKGIRAALLFFFGFLLNGFLSVSPLANMTVIDYVANTAWGGLTFGAILTFLYNFIKVRLEVRLP